MTSISSASTTTLVAVRPITTKDMENVKPGSFLSSQPLPGDGSAQGIYKVSDTLAAAPTQEQQSAARQEEKQQEAFAKMKVALHSKTRQMA